MLFEIELDNFFEKGNGAFITKVLCHTEPDLDMGACASFPCKNAGTCSTVEGGVGYQCSCVDGYTAFDCSIGRFKLAQKIILLSTNDSLSYCHFGAVHRTWEFHAMSPW